MIQIIHLSTQILKQLVDDQDYSSTYTYVKVIMNDSDIHSPKDILKQP